MIATAYAPACTRGFAPMTAAEMASLFARGVARVAVPLVVAAGVRGSKGAEHSRRWRERNPDKARRASRKATAAWRKRNPEEHRRRTREATRRWRERSKSNTAEK